MMYFNALLLLAVLSGVGCVDVQLRQHSSVASATHATALAHALKGSRARMSGSEATASLRGVEADTANDKDDDDSDDSDDSDDQDDDDKADVKQGKVAFHAVKDEKIDKASEALAIEKKKQKAAEEAQKKRQAEAARRKAAKALKDSEMALEAARRKERKAKHEIKYFKDDVAFDSKIAAETKLMTNETQSPALASFLGAFRTEMRDYAMPAYPKYLQSKLDAANNKVKTLEAELKSQQEHPAKEEPEAKPVPVKKAPEAKKEKAEVKKEATAVVDAGEDTAAEVAQKAGETWALSFFANVAMMAIVFGMASAEDKQVKNYTWFILDQVVAIFLAVMYFQAFDALLDFHELGVHGVTASICHALAMLAIVLGTAIMLRKHQVGLAIVCGAGAHLVSFSSIHAAASLQNSFLGMSYAYTTCIFGLAVLGLAVALIGYLVYTAKQRLNLSEDDDFMDKTDDLENDFGAMAFSVVFTMFMRFILTGHHPVDDETEFDHSKAQRTAMFIYALVTFGIAIVVVSFCSKKAAAPTASYGSKRALNFISTVAAMDVAWAFLYWGEWEFYEALFPGEAIKGRVAFAIVMTTCGCFGLFALSKMSHGLARMTKVALTVLGLLIAWSWELCFDAAVESMCEGEAHPAAWKVTMTLSLTAVVLPVYAIYMKPITSKAAEAIGA